jgi:hypothetical protein
VVLVLVGSRQGRRAAALLAVAALAVAGLADGPVAVLDPGAMVVNTITFPLGMAKVASPAASVLPGHLIAAAGGAGHWAAICLVVIAGLAVGAWLVARPPRDVRAAVWRLAVGLTALFLLAPATRAGYFMYPLGLAAWLLLTRPDNPGAASRAAGGDDRPASREPVPAGQPAS